MAAGKLGPGGHCSEWGAEDGSGRRSLPAYTSVSLTAETGARSSQWCWCRCWGLLGWSPPPSRSLCLSPLPAPTLWMATSSFIPSVFPAAQTPSAFMQIRKRCLFLWPVWWPRQNLTHTTSMAAVPRRVPAPNKCSANTVTHGVNGPERLWEPPFRVLCGSRGHTVCFTPALHEQEERTEKLPGARKWRKAFLRPLSPSLLNDLISNCQRVNTLKDLAHYSGSKLRI